MTTQMVPLMTTPDTLAECQADCETLMAEVKVLRCALVNLCRGNCWCDPQPMGADAWRHSDGCDIACQVAGVTPKPQPRPTFTPDPQFAYFGRTE